jgi:hypothetical protein
MIGTKTGEQIINPIRAMIKSKNLFMKQLFNSIC